MRKTICFILLFSLAQFVSALQVNSVANKDEYINLCTFNIHYLTKNDSISWDAPTNRKYRVVDLISKFNFDLIGAQEVDKAQLPDLIPLGYKDYGLAVATGLTTSPGIRNSVLYRPTRFTVLDKGTFWLSNRPDTASNGWNGDSYRNCNWLKLLDSNTSKIFYYFNSHFDSMSNEARIRSARMIKDTIPLIAGDYPAFFMGDLNSIETSEVISILNQSSLNDSRTLSLTQPKGPYGTGNGWRTNNYNVRRIDYIYTYNGNGRNKIEVQEYQVIDSIYNGKTPSDHWPVRIKARIIPNVLSLCVTSPLDDGGTGTLRYIVKNARKGDSVIIAVDTITLSSAIDLNKNIRINGQGVVIKPETTQVSNQRIFTLGADLTSTDSISLYNMKLEGGNITTNTSNAANGGILFLYKNVSLVAKNLEFRSGKAIYGGAIHCNDSTGTRIIMESCSFFDNEAMNNAGAFYSKSICSLLNCKFENNKTSSNGSAIVAIDKITILNSNFRNNQALSTGAYGGAVFITGAATGDIQNCTFDSNTAINSGAGAFGCSTPGTVTTFTNCTFHGNKGMTAGAIYNRAGTINLINCTVACNVSLALNTGAFYAYDASGVFANFVNTILAYNYSPLTGSDLWIQGVNPVIGGSNNIIGNVNSVNPNIVNSVPFSYGDIPDNDSPLFADYYFETGRKFALLSENGGNTKTIALSNSKSVALFRGTPYFKNFEIPRTDQRGIDRNPTPCVGAFEHSDESNTAIYNPVSQFSVSPNPSTNHVYIQTKSDLIKVEIYNLEGFIADTFKTNFYNTQKFKSGVYIVKIYTLGGCFEQRLIVK